MLDVPESQVKRGKLTLGRGIEGSCQEVTGQTERLEDEAQKAAGSQGKMDHDHASGYRGSAARHQPRPPPATTGHRWHCYGWKLPWAVLCFPITCYGLSVLGELQPPGLRDSELLW